MLLLYLITDVTQRWIFSPIDRAFRQRRRLATLLMAWSAVDNFSKGRFNVLLLLKPKPSTLKRADKKISISNRAINGRG